MNNINILHLQFSSKSAGSCAIRLHRGFKDQTKYTSAVLSLTKDNIALEDVTYLPPGARFLSKINNKIESFYFNYDKNKHGLFSNPLVGYPIINHKQVLIADVIYVHWVMMGFLTLKSLNTLISSKKKIIIFMHDMWYMTGGCHYAVDCSLFKKSCTKCPIFPEKQNLANDQLIIKDLMFKKNSNISFVSPSLWLKNLCMESSLLSSQKVHFIPNYFNSNIFVSKDKNHIRRELSLPLNKYIICFGAVSIDSPYKGWKYLKRALGHLSSMFDPEEIEILVFGEINKELINDGILFKINFLGYLEDERKVASAYNASDVFVLPSTMDNQPTTVIESLNCGVPVVVFDLGGSPEMIEHKKNGYIAKPYDTKDLAFGIHYCLTNELQVFVKKDYHPDQVIAKHEELLNSILDENTY